MQAHDSPGTASRRCGANDQTAAAAGRIRRLLRNLEGVSFEKDQCINLVSLDGVSTDGSGCQDASEEAKPAKNGAPKQKKQSSASPRSFGRAAAQKRLRSMTEAFA